MTAAALHADRRNALAALALALLAAGAAQAQPRGMQARIEATVEGYGNLAPRGTDKPIRLTLRTGADGMRADFHFDSGSSDVYLLKRYDEPRAWWISPRGRYMIPANDASGPYWYDMRRPCDSVQGRCSPAPGEFIAGRLARGLNYDHARRGPDGTTRGTLWIDSETGLLLAYRGTRGNRQDSRSFRASRVSYEPLDAAAYARPDALNTPKGMAD